VAANPERLRFYVDESALGLGKTLAAAREDVIQASTYVQFSGKSVPLTEKELTPRNISN
jgi:hypothetical protein